MLIDLSYLPTASEGHMTPTPAVLDLWRDVHERTQFKSVLEIGTNAGHSAAIILTLFPDVHVTSIDIGLHSYVYGATRTLSERFPERFTSIIMDSREYLDQVVRGAEPLLSVDLISVDGDHRTSGASSDLTLARLLRAPHVLLDDFTSYGVPDAYQLHQEALSVVTTYDYAYGRTPVTSALLKNVEI